ncbi:hypothetical protein SSX86_011554 [Deinandra increscens subsp. villosa]|uniref:TRF2/HOY1 PH-like domain-containing protein n=1 Tax=Deinandra increscens subsp. villosa TaxID=3103831 RepID=A0AAP0DB33_9ASTR
MHWSQISAINNFRDDQNKTSRLEIELQEQPELWEEVNFHPNKHTQWAAATYDFTNGQAHTRRRHMLVFPAGVLDDSLNKLFGCDNRLFKLSQQPFPCHNSPFFQNQILDFTCNTSVPNNPTCAPMLNLDQTVQVVEDCNRVFKKSRKDWI